MNIDELMTRDVATVTRSASLSDAGRLMFERDCGFLPVVDAPGGTLCGVITDRDICMGGVTQRRPLEMIPVTTSMSADIVTCNATDDVKTAHALMREHRVRRLPVIDDQRHVVGVISLNDLATHCGVAGLPSGVPVKEVATTLAEICEHFPRAAAPLVAEASE